MHYMPCKNDNNFLKDWVLPKKKKKKLFYASKSPKRFGHIYSATFTHGAHINYVNNIVLVFLKKL